jgi:hypothetical protein
VKKADVGDTLNELVQITTLFSKLERAIKNLFKNYKEFAGNNGVSRWIQGSSCICCCKDSGFQECKDVSWFLGRMGK